MPKMITADPITLGQKVTEMCDRVREAQLYSPGSTAVLQITVDGLPFELFIKPKVEVPTSNHPTQPIIVDEHGVERFKSNKIIDYLFNAGLLDLNKIALMNFSDEDQRQIAQLLGYSVSGYQELSYVRGDDDDET